MNNKYIPILIVQVILLLATSCERNEPDNWIKPEGERTVLFLTPQGQIYNQDQELVTTLPNCSYANQIIAFTNKRKKVIGKTESGTPCMSISLTTLITGLTAWLSGIITSTC